MLQPVTDTLFAAQIPIPYPMKTVTILIDVARPITLIDTAIDTPEARAAIAEALRELGLHWERIERVIVTHHHPDHYGLAGLVEERSGAVVQMLDLDIARGERYWRLWAEWLPGHTRHFAEHGVPPELLSELEAESARTRTRVHPASRLEALQAGDRLTLAERPWEVLWLPGHADGHLGLWDAASRLLIAGDAILPRISPNIGLYAYSRPDPLGDYLGTLARLEALNPARAVVGHYGPFLDDVAGRARELAAHHEDRLEFVLGALREQPMNAFDLSFEMFRRELDPPGRRFAVAETLAHAEYLRLRGDLVRAWNGQSWEYRV